MTVNYNEDTKYIEVSESVLIENYINDNTLDLKVTITLNCGDEVELEVDLTGLDTTDSYLDSSEETLYLKQDLNSTVYNIELSYAQEGSYSQEETCSFYDKDDEIKCKVIDTMLNSNDYLLYEMLILGSQCSDCSCETMCEAFKLLQRNLNLEEKKSSGCTSC